ncbi:MAG: ABC transporter permease [Synechococcus sp.]
MAQLNSSTIRPNLRIVLELSRQDLAVNNSRSNLGWLWWFLDPLAQIGILWFFKVLVFGVDRYQPYVIFVGCAIICWKFLSSSVNRSSNLLRAKESLIKSFPFPTIVLPCSLVFTQLIFFLTGLIVLIGVAVLIGQPVTPMLLQIIPLTLLMILAVLGVTLLVAVLGVFLQDLNNITTHLLRILWYLSPGIYSTSLVAERFGVDPTWVRIYKLSPVAILFEGFRSSIFSPEWISPQDWIVFAGFSFIAVTIGFATYQRFDRRLIKYF